ncbi:MAG: hypothetical protein AAF484_04000 [Pseudomonadota bacterium]
MKPNFALTLSFDGIGLLRRAFPGWNMVGEVDLASPDLTAELQVLRALAQSLDPAGVSTKLVIPNDQIRFLDFDADGLDPEQIGAAALRHLQGATPYPVDDLAYDWSISAGQVCVAAVARETLAEAEAFAVQHGFAPLCFVAAPQTRDFVGEPWFGCTQYAADTLPDDTEVARDTAAVRITGKIATPAPAPETVPETRPETVLQTVPQEPPAEAALARTGPEHGATGHQAGALMETPSTDQPETGTPLRDLPTDTAPAVEVQTAFAFTSIRAQRDPAPDTASGAAPKLSGASRDMPAAGNAAQDMPDEPETAPPVMADIPPEPPVTAGPLDDAQTQPLAGQAATSAAASAAGTAEPRAFVTRRQTQPPKTPHDAAPQPVSAATPRHAKPADEERQLTIFGARDGARVGGKPRYLGVVLTAVLLLFLVGVAAWAAMFREADEVRQAEVSDDAAGTAAPDPDLSGNRAQDADDVAADATIQPPASLTEGVQEARDPGQTPDDTAERQHVSAADAATGIVPEANADAGLTAPSATTQAPAQDSEAASPAIDEARTQYAVSGIWQTAPNTPQAPAILPIDDVHQTAIDPRVLEQDTVALPDAGTYARDALPQAPAPRNAPGTGPADVTDDDTPVDDTPVRASPDGAETPSGVRVFSGRPKLVPPDRPAETLGPAPDAPETAALPDGSADDLARSPGTRPRARPGSATDGTAEDTAPDDTAATGLSESDATLAAIRPQSRPQSTQEPAGQTEDTSTTDPGETKIATEETGETDDTADPFAGATAQAVATSIKPQPRPSGFAQIVATTQAARQRAAQEAERQAAAQAAERAARQQAQTAQQGTAPSAATTTEPQETQQVAGVAVPRNQRLRASAPTSATVARAATEKNVLKLRRVNLIGVYGSAANRRALVRLPNGRYKKVKVGDRLDGGRVTAIGTSELRYSKSGRSVALKMPQG